MFWWIRWLRRVRAFADYLAIAPEYGVVAEAAFAVERLGDGLAQGFEAAPGEFVKFRHGF